MISTIKKYFPHLTEVQENQMEAMMRLYPEWNAKINVVSRKDIDNLEVNHLLHSLAIAKFIGFKSGSRAFRGFLLPQCFRKCISISSTESGRR